MSIEEVIKALTQYNKWRKGAYVEMPSPKYITEVIDKSIKLLEEYESRKDK